MGDGRKGRKRVAAIVPNILGYSPGQRVRIELWASELEKAGWEVDFFPFEDANLHEVLYSDGNLTRKAVGMARCFQNQLSRINSQLDADIIFIYREASLIGPAILERIAARKRIPIIFDIDDPIFRAYKSPANNWASLLKFSRKTNTIFGLSDQVISINNLIGDYARRFNPNVSVVPNCIDTELYLPKYTDSVHVRSPKLVWIGSQSTMQNLTEVVAPIRELQASARVPLLVIGAGESDIGIADVEFRRWSAETEVRDLQEGDIGILPLNDLPWNNWKFFFKIIQYMAVGIPVVAQHKGSSSEVIEDGVNGFLVRSKEEWFEKLSLLTENIELRRKMGIAARRTVEERFSLKGLGPMVVQLFEEVFERYQR